MLSGVIYFIQPAEFINTNVYKIGMSIKQHFNRVYTGYRKGTKWFSINEIDNPRDVEKHIKKSFNDKFTLFKGNEYFSGDIQDMYITDI